MRSFKCPQRAALASAALLLFSGCVQSQAPVVDAGQARNAARMQPQPSPSASTAAAEMMLGQLHALQEELMQLRGIVEEQGYQLETLKQQSLDRYIELDKRIGGAGGPIAGSPVPSQPASAPAPSSDVQMGVVAPPPSAAGGEGPGTSPGSMTAGATKASDMDAYRDAYGRVKAQDFIGATTAFQAFLRDYPESDLAPNAYYWLGELHLQSPQDLAKAEQAFRQVLAGFPQHGKAPDALYKLGRIEFMRDNRERSQELLQQVIDEYGASGSAAPQLAKQFLDQNFP